MEKGRGQMNVVFPVMLRTSSPSPPFSPTPSLSPTPTASLSSCPPKTDTVLKVKNKDMSSNLSRVIFTGTRRKGIRPKSFFIQLRLNFMFSLYFLARQDRSLYLANLSLIALLQNIFVKIDFLSHCKM